MTQFLQEVAIRVLITRSCVSNCCRHFLALSATGLAGVALLGATGRDVEAQSVPRATGSRSITLGIISWDEDIAISGLTKVLLLDDLGYTSVKDTLADVGILFEGVGKGDLAAF